MYKTRIYNAAMCYMGREPNNLGIYCEAAEQALTARLKPGITPADCETTFIAAAALMAVGMYVSMLWMTEGVKSYSAGSVSVTMNEVIGADNELRQQAEIMMAPYINDEKFAFRSVKG